MLATESKNVRVKALHAKEGDMLFMVIETFRDNDMLPIYEHLNEHGRGIPDGLRYIDSWIEPSFARCFQLMECSDLKAMQAWVLHWRGTGASFEIIPVLHSSETRALMQPRLSSSSGQEADA
jgi:hypothetical protein